MEAKKLIIDGVDMIDKFYNQDSDEFRMYVSHQPNPSQAWDWYMVVEFGYKYVITNNYPDPENYHMEYEDVRAVRISKWDDDLKTQVVTMYSI